MGATLDYLLGAAAFVPHGYCLLWRPDLVALHAVSDGVTAIAYFSIPAAILVFLSRRPDLDYPGLAALFATFILACGLTHVADLTTLWWPIYGVEGLMKAVTAMASIMTAAVVWRLIPHALTVPSPAQLRQANEELRAEVARRASAEAALATARDGLEAQVAARTNELAQANARLEAEVAERFRAEQAARDGEARLGIARPESPARGRGHRSRHLGRRCRDRVTSLVGRAESNPRARAGQAADHALFASLIHPDDRDWVVERYRRAYEPAGGGRYRAQFRIRRADDGAERWVEATGRVHFDEPRPPDPRCGHSGRRHRAATRGGGAQGERGALSGAGRDRAGRRPGPRRGQHHPGQSSGGGTFRRGGRGSPRRADDLRSRRRGERRVGAGTNGRAAGTGRPGGSRPSSPIAAWTARRSWSRPPPPRWPSMGSWPSRSCSATSPSGGGPSSPCRRVRPSSRP